MSQSAHSHTTLVLTWKLTPESKFWLEESQYTSLRYHLVETPAHKLLIFNYVSLLVKIWPLWSFVSWIKRISTTTQQNISIGNTSCVICTLCIIDLWMITQCLSILDYPVTTIRNECTKWRRWLETLSTDNYSSSSFWKGTLPSYREILDIYENSIASPDSFHSIEDDGERDGNQSTQDDMIQSDSIVNLNIK